MMSDGRTNGEAGHGPVAADRARVAAIVSEHGHAPIDYFKIWPDKSYFF